MKKHLLFILSLILGISLMSQTTGFRFNTINKSGKIKINGRNFYPDRMAEETGKQKSSPDNTEIVNIIGIGTSANAFNVYEAQRSTLWVVPELNTVTCFHNMGGTLDSNGFAGNFGYDISTDGGSSFTTMVQCYESTDSINFTDAGKNPNHAIYNPTGNTDPANAFVTFIGGNSDNTGGNGNAGLCYGTADIGTPSSHTKHQMLSHDNYYLNAPRGFELTSQGKIFAVEPNFSITTGTYQNNLVITKGVWDETLSDFVYTQELLDAPVTEQLGSPVYTQVAFGADGNIGYIVMLADNGSAQQPGGFTGLYPIYWKTTDAGDTWDGPFFIQLDGPNGLDYIVYHLLTYEMIENLFGNPTPDRTEINYTTAFDFDCAVDNFDNLHIAVVIGPTTPQPYGIITQKNYIAVVDILYYSGKWVCAELGRLNTFRGNFDLVHCDNRVQITTTENREKLFISWIDSDMPYAEENNSPNIFCRGVDPNAWKKTSSADGIDGPDNVTLFSDGMWQSYFFSAPQLCFTENNDTYKIPFVYIDMDTSDISKPIQYKYIQDFSFEEEDFNTSLTGYVGIDENTGDNFTVSQNYPNPSNGNTYVNIKLIESLPVKITVQNISGKTVWSKDFGVLNKGIHKLNLNLKNLPEAIYFYTIQAGDKSITKKLEVN